jgi:hypothetical protein
MCGWRLSVASGSLCLAYKDTLTGYGVQAYPDVNILRMDLNGVCLAWHKFAGLMGASVGSQLRVYCFATTRVDTPHHRRYA